MTEGSAVLRALGVKGLSLRGSQLTRRCSRPPKKRVATELRAVSIEGNVNATLIGYFPKRTMTRPQWLQALGVEEICSVSECVSEGPEDWIQRWKHNDMWAYDTPELAWSIVPAETRREYQLYAYGMFPVEFVDGQKQIFVIPPLRVTPLGSSFRRLGYDIVCRSCGTSFECSPLSCNLMAEEVTVNRYCLVDDPETAFKLASEFEPQRCEPGPYYVVEVWRQSENVA